MYPKICSDTSTKRFTTAENGRYCTADVMFVSRLFGKIRSYPVNINSFLLHPIARKSILKFVYKSIMNKPTMNYLSLNYTGHIEKYNDLSNTQNDIHYIISI